MMLTADNHISQGGPTFVASQLAALQDFSHEEQVSRGYGHTLQEILQQPEVWRTTAEQMVAEFPDLAEFLDGTCGVALTGSGSSKYAGECVRLVLQAERGVPAQTIAGGMILTEGSRAVIPSRPTVLISLARSGDSPESVAAVSQMQQMDPTVKHLVITCNRDGKLSTTYHDDPRVKVIVLDSRTNDRSLVMTSSFTSMVLACRSLGLLKQPDRYLQIANELSTAAQYMLDHYVDAIADVATRDYRQVVYLAGGARFGAARETALKMMEMTAGKVLTMSETYLGLRHGPMSAVQSDSLIVCYLSSSSPGREYECDLIRELQNKRLGMAKIILGADIPSDLMQPGDLALECAALARVGDDSAPVLDVLVGQLLAFFRCRHEGLNPDSPSISGVINRVVGNFSLHLQKR